MVGQHVHLERVLLQADEARVGFKRFGGTGVLFLYPGYGTFAGDIFEPLVLSARSNEENADGVRCGCRSVAAGGPADHSQYSYDPEGDGAESHSLSSKSTGFLLRVFPCFEGRDFGQS